MKLTVVGTGLMGSSFVLAARQADLFSDIQGVEPDPESAKQALALGIVDSLSDAPASDSDLVLIASPSDMVAGWVDLLRAHKGIVFDVGSIKAPILDQLRGTSEGIPPRYVPCHPIAGSELSGPGAADVNLFRGRNVVITPASETDQHSVDVIRGLWAALGAQTLCMPAVEHDQKLALTSHLPHFLAFAYMHAIDPADRPFAGGGFRDFSRIAGSTPSMWSRIFTLNRQALRASLADFKTHLEAMDQALEQDDQQLLLDLIEQASAIRQRFRDD
ncbi:MAG: prephenate dehydrogenase/arogenate dehydrogenase family protein [Proteobacteria bacterium]|nr:prephenate dehydrogenase/arogenate dehydrogenase family protein [Pseudomonadota bacterium]